MANPWEEPIVLESSGAIIPVTATRDASGNVLGLTAGGEQCIVISSDPPSDSDGRVNGTIYIQVLQ